EKDSIKIEFIGYKTLVVSNKELIEGKIFYLHKSSNNLQDVVIKNCNQYEEKSIDYNYGKIDSYWTVSPGFKGEYISYYQNQNNISGYIDEIKLQTVSFSLIPQNFSIPLRLHWYEWDSVKKMPGKELTDTSILIFAYKHGRNKIHIPAKKIFFDDDGVVIGLEFLYPSEMEKLFLQLHENEERQKFVTKNQWSFGMAENNSEDLCFFKVKIKEQIYFHELKRNTKNLKPALNFTIKTCKN
ncbi:MAG: hypothetical protein KGL19_16255, partial [Bacteroidota bacterium]|nr:hypothetical protein [Bacteroidota bacterium]